MTRFELFNKTHIPQAQQLALAAYHQERAAVPALPAIDTIPAKAFDDFIKNRLGIAMLDGDKMLGFICPEGSWSNAYGTAAKGMFVPIHGNGAVPENRENIYKKLYQAAAKVWVENDIHYHIIGLYAHDRQAMDTFFQCGFGSRCVDAVRPLTNFEHSATEGITFSELAKSDVAKVRELRHALNNHLGESPCFMAAVSANFDSWIVRAEGRNSRVFAAWYTGQAEPVAFIEVTDDGENFATLHDSMLNICGAFCLPQHRGKGIMQGLLNHVISQLQGGAVTRLGVDFESFNLESNAFWLKHFTAYTYSVTRRIDERG